MDISRQPNLHAMDTSMTHSKLARSFPSSQSIASTISARGSVQDSWPATGWLRETPNTSPAGSQAGSPALKPASLQEHRSTSTTEESVENASVSEVKNICFIGAGFVGGPTAAVIAYHNPHIQVNVVDLNEQRISAWNSVHLPIHEEGLLKVVRIARDGTLERTVSLAGMPYPVQLKARQPNLFFSTHIEQAITEADMIFICVNTPTKTHGIGAGFMADVSAVETATRTVAKHAKSGAIIVEKSTVPCGTARMIHDILRYFRPEDKFEVLSNPEFLAEGTAIENLMHPDRILIGSSPTLSGLQAAAALKKVYAAWVPIPQILTINTFSSELAKLVANTMLAQRISSINAVSAMCEAIGLGADVEDISLAIGKDVRLGPKFLRAGVGFGGSCFEKDILSLAYLARELHLDVVADYWLAVLRVNEDQRRRFTRNVVRELNGSLRGKKIAILGFTFKEGTNDTRNSIAVHIIKELASEMPREIAVFDPGCAPHEILEEIQRIGLNKDEMERVRVCYGWRECVQQASAVCILTQWRQFRGQHLGATAGSSRNMAMLTDDGLATDTQEACISEMAIRDLERLSRQQVEAPSDDPLGRLKPLPPCPKDCSQCGRGGREQAQEMVNWVEAADMMQEPRWVFDGRNIVNHLELQRLGFRVRGIGKGQILENTRENRGSSRKLPKELET